MTKPITRQWYIVMTTPRGEFAAAADLWRNNCRVWCPWHWRTVRYRGPNPRLSERRQPTFPRYIFAHLADAEIHLATNARDITGILGTADRPKPIPRAVMDTFFARAEGDYLDLDQPAPDEPTVQPFDWVRFAEGPLAGMLAQVSAVDKSEVRVWLEMMGSMREIAVSPESIEPQEPRRNKRGYANKRVDA